MKKEDVRTNARKKMRGSAAAREQVKDRTVYERGGMVCAG